MSRDPKPMSRSTGNLASDHLEDGGHAEGTRRIHNTKENPLGFRDSA